MQRRHAAFAATAGSSSWAAAHVVVWPLPMHRCPANRLISADGNREVEAEIVTCRAHLGDDREIGPERISHDIRVFTI